MRPYTPESQHQHGYGDSLVGHRRCSCDRPLNAPAVAGLVHRQGRIVRFPVLVPIGARWVRGFKLVVGDQVVERAARAVVDGVLKLPNIQRLPVADPHSFVGLGGLPFLKHIAGRRVAADQACGAVQGHAVSRGQEFLGVPLDETEQHGNTEKCPSTIAHGFGPSFVRCSGRMRASPSRRGLPILTRASAVASPAIAHD